MVIASEFKNNLGASSFSSMIVSLHISQDYVRRLRFTSADLIWLLQILIKWGILDRQHRDKRIAEAKMRHAKAPIFPRYAVTAKTESGAKPIDRGRSVPVA